MGIIDLQKKARPGQGRIEYYWFENESIGLKRTLFHRILIPFEPFDSGLEYVSQPEETELCLEWLELQLPSPEALHGLVITSQEFGQAEGSIYLGAAHNPVDLKLLSIARLDDALFVVTATLEVLFEFEGVGKDESFEFQSLALYTGEA